MAGFIDGTKENRAAEKQVPALSVQPSGKEPYGQRNGTAPVPAAKGAPQAVVKPPLLPTPHQQPGPTGRSESAKPSRVFHPYAQDNLNGGVPKNQNIPDSQYVLLRLIGCLGLILRLLVMLLSVCFQTHFSPFRKPEYYRGDAVQLLQQGKGTAGSGCQSFLRQSLFGGGGIPQHRGGEAAVAADVRD